MCLGVIKVGLRQSPVMSFGVLFDTVVDTFPVVVDQS